MKKHILTGLVVLMGISLLGIIAVQVYWFNNSVNVRNELFDRSVNEAMNKAVRRMETGHDLKIIRHFAGIDSGLVVEGIPIPPPPPPPIPGKEELDVAIIRDSVHRVVRLTTAAKGHSGKVSQTFRIDTSTGKAGKATLLTENVAGPVHDSVIIIDQKGNSVLVNSKLKQLKQLSNQLKVEIKGWETGRSIDEAQLKKVLGEEFTDRAIPIGFELAIHKGDSLPFMNLANRAGQKFYRVNLFPNDIFRKNLDLTLFFPERDQFIGRKTAFLLGLSVVFTMVIFLTFYLSIYLIVRQKKISEMKSDFINNMTHEFKTPIATISIAADSITNDQVIGEKEKVRFFAGMIRKENMRMNEQVERILQIARLDRKEYEFSFQPADAHQLIEEAIDGILLQVEKRGGRIETSFEAVNPVVTTDPVHFTNMIYNLLDNANKYSPETPVIKVRTESGPKGIYITVEDSGMGMTRAVQSRIFDKFYRLPSGNVHNVKGFGLGLSYTKAILDANGGTIKVASEPGRGSRFTVFIPYQISR